MIANGIQWLREFVLSLRRPILDTTAHPELITLRQAGIANNHLVDCQKALSEFKNNGWKTDELTKEILFLHNKNKLDLLNAVVVLAKVFRANGNSIKGIAGSFLPGNKDTRFKTHHEIKPGCSSFPYLPPPPIEFDLNIREKQD